MNEKQYYDNTKQMLFEYEYQLELMEGLIETDIPVHLETYLYLNNQVMLLKKIIEQYEKKQKLEETKLWQQKIITI